MSKILHDKDDAKAIAIPIAKVFSENGRAKNGLMYVNKALRKEGVMHLPDTLRRTTLHVRMGTQNPFCQITL